MCTDCDVIRQYAARVQIPAADWLVHEVIDRGPSQFYRYAVRGENLNLPPGHMDREFSWSVQSIDDPRFDLANAKRSTRHGT